jgi:hypothetical protein
LFHSIVEKRGVANDIEGTEATNHVGSLHLKETPHELIYGQSFERGNYTSAI